MVVNRKTWTTKEQTGTFKLSFMWGMLYQTHGSLDRDLSSWANLKIEYQLSFEKKLFWNHLVDSKKHKSLKWEGHSILGILMIAIL